MDGVEFFYDRFVLSFGQSDQAEMLRRIREASGGVAAALRGLGALLGGRSRGGRRARVGRRRRPCGFRRPRGARAETLPRARASGRAAWRRLSPRIVASRRRSTGAARRSRRRPRRARRSRPRRIRPRGAAPAAAIVGAYVRESFGGFLLRRKRWNDSRDCSTFPISREQPHDEYSRRVAGLPRCAASPAARRPLHLQSKSSCSSSSRSSSSVILDVRRSPFTSTMTPRCRPRPGYAERPDPSVARPSTALFARVCPAEKLREEVPGSVAVPGYTVRWPGAAGCVTVTFIEMPKAPEGTPQAPVAFRARDSPAEKAGPPRGSSPGACRRAGGRHGEEREGGARGGTEIDALLESRCRPSDRIVSVMRRPTGVPAAPR